MFTKWGGRIGGANFSCGRGIGTSWPYSTVVKPFPIMVNNIYYDLVDLRCRKITYYSPEPWDPETVLLSMSRASNTSKSDFFTEIIYETCSTIKKIIVYKMQADKFIYIVFRSNSIIRNRLKEKNLVFTSFCTLINEPLTGSNHCCYLSWVMHPLPINQKFVLMLSFRQINYCHKVAMAVQNYLHFISTGFKFSVLFTSLPWEWFSSLKMYR